MRPSRSISRLIRCTAPDPYFFSAISWRSRWPRRFLRGSGRGAPFGLLPLLLLPPLRRARREELCWSGGKVLIGSHSGSAGRLQIGRDFLYCLQAVVGADIIELTSVPFFFFPFSPIICEIWSGYLVSLWRCPRALPLHDVRVDQVAARLSPKKKREEEEEEEENYIGGRPGASSMLVASRLLPVVARLFSRSCTIRTAPSRHGCASALLALMRVKGLVASIFDNRFCILSGGACLSS